MALPWKCVRIASGWKPVQLQATFAWSKTSAQEHRKELLDRLDAWLRNFDMNGPRRLYPPPQKAGSGRCAMIESNEVSGWEMGLESLWAWKIFSSFWVYRSLQHHFMIFSTSAAMNETQEALPTPRPEQLTPSRTLGSLRIWATWCLHPLPDGQQNLRAPACHRQLLSPKRSATASKKQFGYFWISLRKWFAHVCLVVQ